MGKPRKRWPGSQKFQILKECQQSGASVSEVCRRHGISTAQYYQWLKVAEQAAVEALQNGQRDKPSRREERLQQELERMKGVVVEITAENLELKKTLGD